MVCAFTFVCWTQQQSNLQLIPRLVELTATRLRLFIAVDRIEDDNIMMIAQWMNHVETTTKLCCV